VPPLDSQAISAVLIHATNWVGDAVMSLPAIRQVRRSFPEARITVLARPWVADLYARESFADEVVLYDCRRGFRDFACKKKIVSGLRAKHYDLSILFPNSLESAVIAYSAGSRLRAGYKRDGRGGLLTHPVPVPRRGSIPRHESYYYLEMLRRLDLLDGLPEQSLIRLEGAAAAAKEGRNHLGEGGLAIPAVGVSPGAAFGGAKRWLPERFAEAAVLVARQKVASVAIFGTAEEKPVCEAVHGLVSSQGIRAANFAGRTPLKRYIEMAAACILMLTNDSGSMHIASALGVPTVAVFGATDHVATGPTGDSARVVREPVECSPCLLRECPIDHRCMKGVSAGRVADVALELLK